MERLIPLTKIQKNILIGLGALLSNLVANLFTEFSTNVILKYFPERVKPGDIVFLFVPYIQGFEYVSEFLLFVLLVWGVYTLFKKAPKEITYYFYITGLILIIRSFMNILTPFERPLAPDMWHGFVRILGDKFISENLFLRLGMFPSGHVATSMICLISIVKYEASKKLQVLAVTIFVIECITMVISRGHYSIDIVGGIMLAVLVFLWSEKHLKDKLSLK